MAVLVRGKKRTPGILKVPNVFLRNIGVTGGYDLYSREGDGHYLYDVSFAIDMHNAILAGAYFFRVSAFIKLSNNLPTNQIPMRRVIPFLIKSSTNAMLEILRQGSGIQVGNANTSLANYLSYNHINLIRTSGLADVSSSRFLPTINLVEVLNPDTQNSNMQPPGGLRTASPLSVLAFNRTIEASNPFMGLCISAILEGCDPATAFSYGFPVEPSQARFQRVYTDGIVNANQLRRVSQSRAKIENLRYHSYSSNIDVSLQGKNLKRKLSPSLSVLQQGSMSRPGINTGYNQVHRRAKLTTAMVSLPIRFKFPLQLDPSTIHFTFEAIDRFGNTVDSITKMCSVRLSDLNDNTMLDPPIIDGQKIERNGVRITVNQTDPRADCASIYRKIINLDKFNRSSKNGWKFISKIGASIDNPGIMFDTSDQGRAVIYRAVAQTRSGRQSCEFGSVALPPVAVSTSATYDVPLMKQGYNDVSCVIMTISRYAGGSSKDVKVEIHNPNAMGAFSMFVLATDITSVPPRNDPRKIYVKPTGVSFRLSCSTGVIARLWHNNSAPIVFKHSRNSLLHDHLYEYTVFLKNLDGTITKARIIGDRYYRYNAIDDDGIKLNVSQAKIINEGRRNIIRFDISADFQKDGLTELIEMMEKSKALEPFIENIRENKERFNDILKISVKRIDLSNGTIVDFGPQDPPTFVDNEASDHVGSRGTLEGKNYRYEFRVLKASIFDLLIGTSIKATDPISLVSYQKKISKFLNSKTMKNATLSSIPNILTGDYEFLSPGEIFNNGQTSIAAIRDISIPNLARNKEIQSIMAERTGIIASVIIKWTSLSRLDSIDHFQVYARYEGIEAVIGVVHPYESKGSYMYIDRKLSGLVGQRSYAVRHVYDDYSLGKMSEYVTVSINSTLNLLERVTR